MPETNIPVVQFKSKRPIAEFPTQGYILSGTVDLDAATTIVSGVPIQSTDTVILGVLQEKKVGASLGLVNLISIQALGIGSSAFKVDLTTAPLVNQTILLGFAVFEP